MGRDDDLSADELAEAADTGDDDLVVPRLDPAGMAPDPAAPADDSDEPVGLEEVDPIGLGAMVSDLADQEETPSAGPKTYADVKRMKKRRTWKVPLVLDTSKRMGVINANAERREARDWLDAGPDDPDRQARLERAIVAVQEAETALEEVTVVWLLGSISRTRLRNLMASCPPTPEQRRVHKGRRAAASQPNEDLLYDPDRFQPALVAACSVEPALDIEEAVDMWEDDSWTEGELEALFLTAWNLNQGVI